MLLMRLSHAVANLSRSNQFWHTLASDVGVWVDVHLVVARAGVEGIPRDWVFEAIDNWEMLSGVIYISETAAVKIVHWFD